jgi:hypothetical protein
MSISPNPARTVVTTAVIIVLVLGGLLTARLFVRTWQTSRLVIPGPTNVEKPRSTNSSVLEVPCWTCPSANKWPIRFRTDLDLVAPLGDGAGNAADFFALFEKNRGPRAAEAETLMSRRFEADGEFGQIVAGDDDLLLEAEPWVDQATMSFYPGIFPMEGTETRITNLLFALTLARSWTARGVAADDPQRGLEDCRKAIRLGRLLRQEDVVIINDLVGLACIHIGSRGIYRIAQRTGDLDLALLASVVLGELAPQRFMTMEKISVFDLGPYIRRGSSGAHRLDLPDSQLEAMIAEVDLLAERRFFGEAILSANVVLHLGTPEQQIRARDLLDRLESDEDPIISDFAHWALTTPPTDQSLAASYPHPSKR